MCKIFYVASIVVLAFTISFSEANSKVYRCESETGQVTYQQIPCVKDSQPIEIPDYQSGWSSLRPGEQKLLEYYRKQDQAQTRSRRKPQKRAEANSKACWSRRAQLEAIKERLRHGYSVNESARLHRKRGEHQDYLRRFCS